MAIDTISNGSLALSAIGGIILIHVLTKVYAARASFYLKVKQGLVSARSMQMY